MLTSSACYILRQFSYGVTSSSTTYTLYYMVRDGKSKPGAFLDTRVYNSEGCGGSVTDYISYPIESCVPYKYLAYHNNAYQMFRIDSYTSTRSFVLRHLVWFEAPGCTAPESDWDTPDINTTRNSDACYKNYTFYELKHAPRDIPITAVSTQDNYEPQYVIWRKYTDTCSGGPPKRVAYSVGQCHEEETLRDSFKFESTGTHPAEGYQMEVSWWDSSTTCAGSPSSRFNITWGCRSTNPGSGYFTFSSTGLSSTCSATTTTGVFQYVSTSYSFRTYSYTTWDSCYSICCSWSNCHAFMLSSSRCYVLNYFSPSVPTTSTTYTLYYMVRDGSATPRRYVDTRIYSSSSCSGSISSYNSLPLGHCTRYTYLEYTDHTYQMLYLDSYTDQNNYVLRHLVWYEAPGCTVNENQWNTADINATRQSGDCFQDYNFWTVKYAPYSRNVGSVVTGADNFDPSYVNHRKYSTPCSSAVTEQVSYQLGYCYEGNGGSFTIQRTVNHPTSGYQMKVRTWSGSTICSGDPSEIFNLVWGCRVATSFSGSFTFTSSASYTVPQGFELSSSTSLMTSTMSSSSTSMPTSSLSTSSSSTSSSTSMPTSSSSTSMPTSSSSTSMPTSSLSTSSFSTSSSTSMPTSSSPTSLSSTLSPTSMSTTSSSTPLSSSSSTTSFSLSISSSSLLSTSLLSSAEVTSTIEPSSPVQLSSSVGQSSSVTSSSAQPSSSLRLSPSVGPSPVQSSQTSLIQSVSTTTSSLSTTSTYPETSSAPLLTTTSSTPTSSVLPMTQSCGPIPDSTPLSQPVCPGTTATSGLNVIVLQSAQYQLKHLTGVTEEQCFTVCCSDDDCYSFTRSLTSNECWFHRKHPLTAVQSSDHHTTFYMVRDSPGPYLDTWVYSGEGCTSLPSYTSYSLDTCIPYRGLDYQEHSYQVFQLDCYTDSSFTLRHLVWYEAPGCTVPKNQWSLPNVNVSVNSSSCYGNIRFWSVKDQPRDIPVEPVTEVDSFIPTYVNYVKYSSCSSSNIISRVSYKTGICYSEDGDSFIYEQTTSNPSFGYQMKVRWWSGTRSCSGSPSQMFDVVWGCQMMSVLTGVFSFTDSALFAIPGESVSVKPTTTSTPPTYPPPSAEDQSSTIIAVGVSVPIVIIVVVVLAVVAIVAMVMFRGKRSQTLNLTNDLPAHPKEKWDMFDDFEEHNVMTIRNPLSSIDFENMDGEGDD